METSPYTGRFAPSPTGPLHIGSLIAAVASYLEARTHSGRWLLRMEDIDEPRNVPGAASTILEQLEAHGLEWDGDVLWQTRRIEAYQAALDALRQSGDAYPCACTRKEIADSSLRAPDGTYRYPGTCRQGLPANRQARAWRIRTCTKVLSWQDQIQGTQQEDLWDTVGDFVLKRADGRFAYQLAVVVDDAYQGINHVVRGADLLGSTARQIWLQEKLQLPRTVYAHLPVATNPAGEKLSKQTLAAPVNQDTPVKNLWLVLDFLGQQPPAEILHAGLTECWPWALAHWNLEAVPRQHGAIVHY